MHLNPSLKAGDLVVVEAAPLQFYGIRTSASTLKLRVISFGIGLVPSGHPPVCVTFRRSEEVTGISGTVLVEVVDNGIAEDGQGHDFFMHHMKVIERTPAENGLCLDPRSDKHPLAGERLVVRSNDRRINNALATVVDWWQNAVAENEDLLPMLFQSWWDHARLCTLPNANMVLCQLDGSAANLAIVHQSELVASGCGDCRHCRRCPARNGDVS